MTLKIDIDTYKRFHESGGLEQHGFGDLKETACLFSALSGETGFGKCDAAGWPHWLAELAAYIFDSAPASVCYERGLAFALALQAADERCADLDRVFRDIRLTSVLPIALHSVGDGDEPWRVACRGAVQWSIDNDGQAIAGAAEAVEAAMAAMAKWAARAVRAARAAEAAGAAEAARAADAVDARWAAANTAIYESTLAALRGEPYALVWSPEVTP